MLLKSVYYLLYREGGKGTDKECYLKVCITYYIEKGKGTTQHTTRGFHYAIHYRYCYYVVSCLCQCFFCVG